MWLIERNACGDVPLAIAMIGFGLGMMLQAALFRLFPRKQ